MQEKSYRLAQYEIMLDANGGIWWKSHGGFAETKSGRCFIEGNILFLSPSEETEPGFFKNEWLQYLTQFPQWDKTGYYCPSYTLYACEGERMRGQKKHPGMAGLARFSRAVRESVEKTGEREPVPTQSPSIKSTGGIDLASLAAAAGIEQVKGKLGKALRRCQGLIRHNSKKDDPED